jgi:uncharacterized protein YoaH (UPF0181 family)
MASKPIKRRMTRMTRSLLKVTTCLAVLAALAGCASLQGYPERDEDADAIVAALKAAYATPQIIADYEGKSTATEKKSVRDIGVAARLLILDARFAEFEKAMFSQRSTLLVSTDTLKSGFSVAGALTSAGQTSQILSGLSGAFDAASSSVDSNVYKNKTQDAVLAMMHAGRAKVRERILTGLQKEVSIYPLASALSDLEDYYVAGSVPGALAAITADAGKSKAEADENIQTLLSPGKNLGQNINLVMSELRPALGKLTVSQMQGLISNPPASIPPDAQKILAAAYPAGLATQNAAGSRAILELIIDRVAVSKDDAAFEAWRARLKELALSN